MEGSLIEECSGLMSGGITHGWVFGIDEWRDHSWMGVRD